MKYFSIMNPEIWHKTLVFPNISHGYFAMNMKYNEWQHNVCVDSKKNIYPHYFHVMFHWIYEIYFLLLGTNGITLISCCGTRGHSSKSNLPLRLVSKIISYNVEGCHLHTSRCHMNAQRTIRINYKLSCSVGFMVAIKLTQLFSFSYV